VTGTLIAPVIPSSAAARPARAPAAARTLPLAVPPALSRPPALGRDVVYGLALCVPIISSTSCDQVIFVDQATDVCLFPDAVQIEINRFG
jgi:hypothetical protein